MTRTSRKSSRRRGKRRHAGGALTPSPLNSSLSGSWSSRMSAGQSADFFKYHQGQHGGMAPVNAITSGSSLTDPTMRSAAMLGSIDRSMQEIAHMRDTPQAGGKRRGTRGKRRGKRSTGGKRRSYKKKRSTGGKRRSYKKKRSTGGKRSKRRGTRRRQGGGSVAPAPFTGTSGMLLSTSDYEKAGLNGGWKSDPAFDAARARDTM